VTPAEALALVQGTDEWRAARCGSVGASRVADILRKTKDGSVSASRKNYLAELLIERLTSKPTEGFRSRTMELASIREPEARRWYSFVSGHEVKPVGMVLHPSIKGAHASPDGLIGKDGLYEGKAPEPAQHLALLLGGGVAADYLTQMQWQMACTGRKWCVFVSYNPEFPVALQFAERTVKRDNARISDLESEVAKFCDELSVTVELLTTRRAAA
jgi:hypothetical protein